MIILLLCVLCDMQTCLQQICFWKLSYSIVCHHYSIFLLFICFIVGLSVYCIAVVELEMFILSFCYNVFAVVVIWMYEHSSLQYRSIVMSSGLLEGCHPL